MVFELFTYGVETFANPTWSPDGSQIAYGGRDGIYLVALDATDVRRLLIANGDQPAWSPDGAKIAFYSERDGQNAGEGDIYVVNVDGSGLTRLTYAPGGSAAPDWSPDGNLIVFSANRNGNSDIYVMNANGAAQRALTNDPARESDPNWQ